MKRMLINATQLDEVRVAITDNTHLTDLDIEVPGHEQKKANIYKGIISSIEPSLGAVFVNYGAERHGFLPFKEISSEYYLDDEQNRTEEFDIRKLVKEGQPLVVQIEKEERGTKGAALTTFISLAGSFIVLMPNNPRAGGISRRIEGEERDQMREAISQLETPTGMSLILRTAGLGKSGEELKWDLSILLKYWEAVKQAATLKAGTYLIHQEGDVITRSIRDYLRQDIDEIIIDNENAYQRAYNYLNQIRPDFMSRLKLYKDTLPLFSRFQIEHQIETAFQREVRLPSGGSVVIDHSEALVAIDINSARATKGSNIEETALNTNLEAAQEIARQLRIRDIGGLVVIDFIDMTPIRNQREVENCLRNALRPDRARIQLGRISRFGLMEMSRQRIRSSLAKTNHISCPRCDGRGSVRSIESQALSVVHLLQEQAVKASHIHFQLQLPLELAAYVSNEKKHVITQIEECCQVKISLIPNQFIEHPNYQLKQKKCMPDQLRHGKGTASYKLVQSFKIDQPNTKRPSPKPSAEPAITQFLSNQPLPDPSRLTTNQGLIKRLWSKVFGCEQPGRLEVNSGKSESAQKKHTCDNQRHKKTAKPSNKNHRTEQKKPSSKSDKPPSSKGRTRRGTRGGSQQRNKTEQTLKTKTASKNLVKETPNIKSAQTSKNHAPFPEELDNFLPKSDHPASTMSTKEPPSNSDNK